MSLNDRLSTYLKQHHLRQTQPRRIVFEFLVNAKAPVKLRQIIELQGNWADRASLYRTVKLYKQLGIIHEVHRPGGDWLELGGEFSAHHHHLTCTHCGITQVIENPPLEDHLSKIAKQLGFVAHDHHVEISGLCASCLILGSQQ